MKFEEAKEKFIQTWGTFGSNWGINRTMAQIHALLLISPEPLSAEEIMEDLNISRGNANMNIRTLIDWGIIFKELKSGERKEFFYADKNILHVASQVAKERRRRELEPVLRILDQVKDASKGDSPEEKEFNKVVHDLQEFSTRVDSLLELLIKADANWFFNNIFRMLK
jgi:DNA-binding transcriptional regulator GbsR (MarR family)